MNCIGKTLYELPTYNKHNVESDISKNYTTSVTLLDNYLKKNDHYLKSDVSYKNRYQEDELYENLYSNE